MDDGKIVMPACGCGCSVVSDELKNRIDGWIRDNGLNEYGDHKDTCYTGGTPLFDETSGRTTDRYQYILQNHPELKG